MTRDFILTWAPKFNELPVRVDPVGLKDWCSPLGMVQWVVGHAMYGAPKRWLETRRDDCVTVMGVAGRWEGLLYHQPFVILDTLFAARPEPKSRKKKAMGADYVGLAQQQAHAAQYAQQVQAAGGVFYLQAPDGWVQYVEGAMPAEPVQDE